MPNEFFIRRPQQVAFAPAIAAMKGRRRQTAEQDQTGIALARKYVVQSSLLLVSWLLVLSSSSQASSMSKEPKQTKDVFDV